ncbi:MAG TPA: PBP1A family penicillin-binding protein [Gallionellaceae bacterium]
MTIRSSRWFYPVIVAASLVSLPILILLFAAIVTYPTLPSLDALTEYQPKRPLQIFSAEGTLIGEFGEEKRILVKIDEVPDLMKKAILAAEDERFYEHGGVDYIGVVRAALSNVISRGTKQGASTITMQVARNFFLSREKTFSRKFNETLLAFKIEHNLSKDEILQLYINQIYLGQHAYGFAAAATAYFGKPLAQLNVAEMAVLAGLPKAPSLYNPIANPQAAKQRQLYVLKRMRALDFIDDAQLAAAQQQPIVAKRGGLEFAVHADYLAEMVRQAMVDRYDEEAYNQGYKVYTTIRAADQAAAYAALRDNVEDYDERHGYRGPESYADLGKDANEESLEEALQEFDESNGLLPAIVQSLDKKTIRVYSKGGQVVDMAADKQALAKPSLGSSAPLNQRIRVGSIIRIKQDAKGTWRIGQLPQVEAAFVSASPRDGAIYALVGGFDFNRSKFNHVTQAWRQPGSSIKPFIYSSALEKGYTPATIINDAPLVFDTAETGGEAWEPKNYDGTYDGPITMRQALIRSKNLVSIRILQAITPQYARDYLTKFGFEAEKQPPYLTMALGSGSVTPMKMLEGYSVFANGGFHVTPYFIQRIEDASGTVLYKAAPTIAGETAERVIDVRNAYTMVNMMQDVVRHGTAIAAMSLGRQDLAGKTGTTSDFMDAWFCGYQPTLVGIAWLGFDNPHTLGSGETGGGAALPMWISYMGSVLKNVPQAAYTMPDGIVPARINSSGLRDPAGERSEIFYKENLPPEQGAQQQENPAKTPDSVQEQLF